MSGENNLADGVESDLREMVAGSRSLSSDERLVAFVDDVTSGSPCIIELKNGQRDTLRRYDSDFYASDPEHFREVIEWIEAACPAKADDYALVLWGHATGWLVVADTIAQSRRAYGQDNGNNGYGSSLTTRWMNITQMARALDGLPPFSYILADCCCMMCAEAAYELRHSARYLIGSPAEIPADGAPYDLLAKSLFATGNEFYRDIADIYYDYYLNDFNTDPRRPSYLRGSSVPLSVCDLSQMDALAEATRAILKAPEEYTTDSIAYYFHYDSPVMYDMSCLLQRNTAEADFRAWREVFDRAVPYRRFSPYWMTIYTRLLHSMPSFSFTEDTYGGLSLFIERPYYEGKTTYNYNTAIRNLQWYRAVGWERFAED